MTPADARRPVYTVVQLAAFLGWSDETIYREIRAGRLRARKRRADTVIIETDLLAYLDSLPPVQVETAAAPSVQPTSIRQPQPARGRVTRLFEILPSNGTEVAR